MSARLGKFVRVGKISTYLAKNLGSDTLLREVLLKSSAAAEAKLSSAAKCRLAALAQSE